MVCPDLRGYGESSKPPTTDDHAPYSKRAMAGDCLALMLKLGHDQFAVAGHDRGCYVAFRLAMDHPEAVSRLAVLDGIPIGEALARCDANFAEQWWHWFFLGNPSAGAERVINADPEAWYHSDRYRAQMGEQAWQDYLRAIRNPATVHAMCEDYRAGLGIDRGHDDADRAAGRQVSCPVLVLWAALDDMGALYGDPAAVWRRWAEQVEGLADRLGAPHGRGGSRRAGRRAARVSRFVRTGPARSGCVSEFPSAGRCRWPFGASASWCRATPRTAPGQVASRRPWRARVQARR